LPLSARDLPTFSAFDGIGLNLACREPKSDILS
jgi:hypothetical protein